MDYIVILRWISSKGCNTYHSRNYKYPRSSVITSFCETHALEILKGTLPLPGVGRPGYCISLD